MQEHDVERFIEPVTQHLAAALREISAGQKETHWMWFMFPQLQSLGGSATAHRFGIVNLAHARRFLQHPVLGANYEQLVEATHKIIVEEGGNIGLVFGYPDDLKLMSSLTLFELAATAEQRTLLAERCAAIIAAGVEQGLTPCSTTLTTMDRGA